jgi:hypothetical protein
MSEPKTCAEIQEGGEVLYLTDELIMVRPGGQWSQIEVWACETGDLNDGAYEFAGVLLASDDLHRTIAGHAASGYETRRRLHDIRTAAKMTVDRPADTERGGMATMMTADDLGSMLIRTGDLDVIGAYYNHLGVAAIYCRPDDQGMLYNEMFDVPAASLDEATARVDEVMADYRRRRLADLETRTEDIVRAIGVQEAIMAGGGPMDPAERAKAAGAPPDAWLQPEYVPRRPHALREVILPPRGGSVPRCGRTFDSLHDARMCYAREAAIGATTDDIEHERAGATGNADVQITSSSIPPKGDIDVAISLCYRPADPGIYTGDDGWATYAGLAHAGSGHAAAGSILSILGKRRADVTLPVAGAQTSHHGFRAVVDWDSGDEPRHAIFEVPAGTIGGAITALASAFADFFGGAGADDDDQPEPCPACHGALWDSSADDPHGSMPCGLCGGCGWIHPDQEMIDWIEGAEISAGSGTIAYWAGEEIPLDWTCLVGIPEAGRMIAALPTAT